MNDYSFYYFSIDGIFGIWPEDREQERRYYWCGSIYLAIHCRVIFDESYDEIYEEYADEESWV